jgi:hypothetical protein
VNYFLSAESLDSLGHDCMERRTEADNIISVGG